MENNMNEGNSRFSGDVGEGVGPLVSGHMTMK